MSDSQNRVIKLGRSPSRSKKDVLRATIVEQLEEARGSCQYICETCEYALENHPVGHEGVVVCSAGTKHAVASFLWDRVFFQVERLMRCASHKPFLVKLLNGTKVKTLKVLR